MDSSLFQSSSPEVQKAFEFLDSVTEEEEKYSPYYATIFYVLDRVGSPKAEEFVEKWEPKRLSTGDIAHEYPIQFYHLLKLEKKHNMEQWDEKEEIGEIIEYLKSCQSVRGEIQSSAGHSKSMLPFVTVAPDSNFTENAVEYYIDNRSSITYSSWHKYSREAAAAIALAEYDFFKYKDTIIDIITDLQSTVTSNEIENIEKEFTAASNAPVPLVACSKLNDMNFDLVEDISNHLISSQQKEGYWFKKDRPDLTAHVTLGLIASGYGPKVTRYSSDWEKQLEQQRQSRIKPQFVRTYPGELTASYRAEIQEKSLSLIKSANDELRINSLYIDMLFDEIIDQIIENKELEVKILTRGRNLKGGRKKIKKDVLNELIEATDGKVKQNHRLHSRMVVSDREALLVSSADLTRDQLRDEYNAGIFTKDSGAVQESVNYFDKIWESSDRVEHS